jgi:hypothetical protein
MDDEMVEANEGRDPGSYTVQYALTALGYVVETEELDEDLETVHIEQQSSFNAIAGKSVIPDSGSSRNIASDLSLFVKDPMNSSTQISLVVRT